jgi:replicative DNA helicase
MDEVKLPPHSKEAEQQVLGGMLRGPEAIGEVLQIIGPDQFYLDAHQKIAKALVDLYHQGRPTDAATVAEVLKDRKQIEDIGGYGYLGELWGGTFTTATAKFHAGVVRDKAIRRQVILACHDTLREAEDPTGPPEELLEAAQEKLSAIAQIGTAGEVIEAKTLTARGFDRIDERVRRYRSGQTIIGVPSGLFDLDRLTSGFQNGELIVMAARTSVGKTSLGLQIAQNAAIEEGLPVYVVSLEQPALDLWDRAIACRGLVDLRKIRSGDLNNRELEKIRQVGFEISQSGLYFFDTPSKGVMHVAATARLLKRRQRLGLFVVDYLQLVPPENPRVKREEQVATISRRLKGLAMELQIPVIAMAQLNRDSDDRKDKEPWLSDLRESGAIEQDADTVILLWSSSGDGEHEPTKEIEVKIAKQRNGPIGRFKLLFRKAFVRFEDGTPAIERDPLFSGNGEMAK